MWSTIFTAASTVMNRGRSGGSSAAVNAAQAKAAVDFSEYKRDLVAMPQAVPVGAVTGAAQYNQLLAAWDSYLNNEYLELAKRIIT
tara:strand:- start:727 stop:984 length:258 start_codon:yes stop_codon:yes gene_type:complete